MKNLHDIRLGNDFLEMTPNAQGNQNKIRDKLDSSNFKILCFQKTLLRK